MRSSCSVTSLRLLPPASCCCGGDGGRPAAAGADDDEEPPPCCSKGGGSVTVGSSAMLLACSSACNAALAVALAFCLAFFARRPNACRVSSACCLSKLVVSCALCFQPSTVASTSSMDGIDGIDGIGMVLDTAPHVDETASCTFRIVSPTDGGMAGRLIFGTSGSWIVQNSRSPEKCSANEGNLVCTHAIATNGIITAGRAHTERTNEGLRSSVA